MMKDLTKDLKIIINQGLLKNPLPIVKGKSIRMGKIAIRKSSKGFIIFDVKESKQIDIFDTKHGALAFAKTYQEKQNNIIKHYDKLLSKHNIDKSFYEHNLKRCNDEKRKVIIETRLKEAEYYTDIYIAKLENIIFGN